MFSISVAVGESRLTGLSLLLSHLPAAERTEQVHELLEADAAGHLCLDGLLVAKRDQQVIGASFFLMQPDHCAHVWVPVIAEPESSELTAAIGDALLQEVGRCVRRKKAWIAQVLLEPESAADRALLARNGFPHLTDLSYLQCPVSEPLPVFDDSAFERAISDGASFSGTPSLQVVARFDPEDEASRQRFAEIIQRTYSGSHDCPELESIRSGNAAVKSHELTGLLMPEQWLIFADADGDVGLLILADHPERTAWEVVYMGVLPEFRGRGYGKEIMKAGLFLARLFGQTSVLLAVDQRNRFAWDMYSRLGFVQTEIRSVHAMFPSKKFSEFGQSTDCEQ